MKLKMKQNYANLAGKSHHIIKTMKNYAAEISILEELRTILSGKLFASFGKDKTFCIRKMQTIHQCSNNYKFYKFFGEFGS